MRQLTAFGYNINVIASKITYSGPFNYLIANRQTEDAEFREMVLHDAITFTTGGNS